MPNPHLNYKAIRFIREPEATRATGRIGCRPRGRGHYRERLRSYWIYIRDLDNRRIEVRGLKVLNILRIQVPAISQTQSKPSRRIDPDASECINRVVIESISCSTGDVLH